jgi:hypothetical protein
MNETKLNNILDLQFAKFFRHMGERFDELRTEIDAKATLRRFDNVQRTLDVIATRLDDIKVEMAAQNHLTHLPFYITSLYQNTSLTLFN